MGFLRGFIKIALAKKVFSMIMNKREESKGGGNRRGGARGRSVNRRF